ncbi:MAG: ribonuclease P protein component 1 [Methanomicrobiales archaeon]|nr:ribonuclease P protein component 1 [Methanomicrobiales archaeon]NYT21299.1 ribonuclease P protein component 1 [Methanomicrobiales archaeon]
MIAPRNILRHEFIGLDVLVVEAANPLHRGISGRIIDETRNTLVIRTSCGDRRIPKPFTRFRFSLGDGLLVEVDGSALVMAPEKRITQHTKKRGP